MRNLFPLVLLIIVCFGCGNARYYVQPSWRECQLTCRFRAMSYNIRSGESIDGKFNLTKTAQVINEQQVDLVGLQEVDNNTQRHPVDEPSLLANLTNMQVVFAKMRNFEGGEYGIAILSKFEIQEQRIFYYHNQSTATFDHMKDCSEVVVGDYCQGALAIQVTTDRRPHAEKTNESQKLWFVTTHLGLGGVQLNEAIQLVQFVKDLSNTSIPVLTTGDLNSLPSSDALQTLYHHRMDDQWVECGKGNGYTFNSSLPWERIDYQLMYSNYKKIACTAAEVVDTTASDHRPVVVEYKNLA